MASTNADANSKRKVRKIIVFKGLNKSNGQNGNQMNDENPTGKRNTGSIQPICTT
jgi:hypothetical protein